MAENLNPAPEENKEKKAEKKKGKFRRWLEETFGDMDASVKIGFFGSIILGILGAILGVSLGHKAGKEEGLNEAKAEHTREFFEQTNKVTRHVPLHLVDEESNTDCVIMDSRQYEDLNRHATRNIYKILDALSDNPPPEVPEPQAVRIPEDDE